IPNHRNDPTRMPQSAQVRSICPHAHGRQSLAGHVAMITYRSNHLPMLMKIEMANRAVRVVRTFVNQSTCDTNALEMIIVQPDHHWGPKARRQKVVCSNVLLLYQAMKYSMKYA